MRKEDRSGELRWVIDIPYRTADGRRARYRRDAQVQTKAGAEAEHRRLVAELARSGTLKSITATVAAETAPLAGYTFADAVKHYRATHMRTSLKATTRASYNVWLDSLLVPRFGERPLADVNGKELALLDAELVDDELADSTRSNIHSVFRSVLRNAVRGGFLESMPAMPPMPKVGRKKAKPMRRDDYEAILAAAAPSAKLAFELIAFGGLRPCEVRGLRWPDVDLKAQTLTIRIALARGEETTPKSHHAEVLPLCERMHNALERTKANRKSPFGTVALTAYGKPWGDSGLNQAFKRAKKRAGKSGWTVHGLRHFFVTELFRNGVSAAVVQRLARRGGRSRRRSATLTSTRTTSAPRSCGSMARAWKRPFEMRTASP